MPKLYYPTLDEVQGAEPLNELVWFKRYQHLLVKLANTDWGRDLLLIDKHPYPVVAIGKNYVRFHLGVWDDQDHWMSDFRVGAKWGNVIRYRWLEVKKAIDRMILLSVLESWHPIYDRNGKLLLPVGGGTHTTYYPDADVESTTVDGSVTNNPPSTSFATLRNASSGTLAEPSAAAPYMARLSATTTTNEYSIIVRGFFLFNTIDIPTEDTIVSATFDLVYTERGDGLSASIAMVDVVGSLASNTNLETGDYNKLGTTRQAADLTYAGLTANSATYNSFTLNSVGLGNISKTGITEFGTRIDLDLDDMSVSEAQALWSSEVQSYLAAAMADNTVLTDKAPRLVVTHNSPFTPKVIIF